MHPPFYISIGDSQIHFHQIFEIAAFALGFRYFVHLRKKQTDPLTESQRLWVLVGATFGALIGSRLLGSLENPALWTDPEVSWWQILANKTLVGGLLGGLIGVEWTKSLQGIKTSSGDLFVFPLILAMCIGRIGCFSMGILEDTYGLPTSLPWAMNLGDDIPRHPVTLYEIGFLIVLALGIKAIEKKGRLENGFRFKLFMIAYLGFRFCLDFIKPTHEVLFGWSSIQLACIACWMYYAKSIYRFIFQFPSLRIV